MVQRCFERLEGSGTADVAQCDGHVPEKARVARAADGTPPGPGKEFLLREAQQAHERLGMEPVGLGREPGFLRLSGEAVPGTDVLAVVAAEDAVADGLPELDRDGSAEFDGEVGNAPSAVHHVGLDDRVRRAGGHAAGAGSAVVRMRVVGRQVHREQDLAEKEPGAAARRDDIRVLADPAEAGPFGERLFEQGAVIHQGRDPSLGAGRTFGKQSGFDSAGLGERGQGAEFRIQHPVVVLAPRVLRDHPAARRRGGGTARVVVEAAGDHGPLGVSCRAAVGAPDAGGVATPAGVAGHPVHRAVVAAGEPFLEPLARVREPGRGETDRGEAQAEALFADCVAEVRPPGAGFGHWRQRTATCRSPADSAIATCSSPRTSYCYM